MIEPFQPDLFSRTGPNWFTVSEETAASVTAVLDAVGEPKLQLKAVPEQSGALEINSSNIRLTTTNGRYLLKRWSDSAGAAGLHRTLELMDWLGTLAFPVPRPVTCDGAWLFEHGGSRWTLFPFVEGNWFTGSAGELESSAGVSGAISSALGSVPRSLLPDAGPEHLTDADDDVLSRMGGERHRWAAMLGGAYASLLAECWGEVMTEWHRLRASPPPGGPVQAVHFDLHPHNLLMHGGRVAGVLDFEACKTMPVGYAIAFAGLKQGRQAVVVRGASPAAAGSVFLARAREACPALEGVTRFADLAAAEAIRRVALIIRLNVEQGITTWNKVLPIQLAHLQESRMLFSQQDLPIH